MDLDTCRQSGMSAGQIPFTAIAWWTDRYCVTESQADRVTYVVMGLDKVYLEHCDKKSQAKSEGGTASGGTQRPAKSSGKG